jgi:hypothetical protein
MLNSEFDYEQLLSSRDLIQSEKLYRWVSLDQEIIDRSFFSIQFQDCNWLNTSFTHTRFLSCKFEDSTMNYTSFQYCYFENVVFDRWVIRNTRFENCVLVNCQFRTTELASEMIDQVSFKNSYLHSCLLGNLPALLENKDCLDAFHDCILLNTHLAGVLSEKGHILSEKLQSAASLENTVVPIPQMIPKSSTSAPSNSAANAMSVSSQSQVKPNSPPSPAPTTPSITSRFNQLEIESKEN